jgi:hypothetical protein
MAADFLKRSREPAPVEPGTSAAARAPGLLERHRRRARLREQLALREEMLLELGALVFELHRQGQRAPELLQARAAELDAVDADVRAMQESLDRGDPSAWPTGAAPEWNETGEWDAATGQTGEWDGTEADWGETGEWEATDEAGEWVEPTGDDPGETREWSVAEALDAEDVTADPHDPTAEDAIDATVATPDDPPEDAPHGADRDDRPAEERP